MFFPASDFEFATALEANWLTVRQELEQLQPKNFIDWPEKNIYNQGWEVFGLYAFGQKIAENCRLCPETTKLVEAIPGMLTAGFSSLAPGTYIGPHFGATQAVLRCHLGVIVPDNCAIRVDKETRSWQEGKCLIFDDTFEHEAWNKSEQTRIVLLIDFTRPASTINEPLTSNQKIDEEYWLKILSQTESVSK
ncbi:MULTISPECIES: aspartyl/asparaginyl beta-hydroxylase domain-containing protein [Calothrix]|uniref:Aspartyl/asparaginyl beta-hydroxylase domain-containing protein n=2 Tax=Calothrix TaxID=1186 RepID=A0ABR8A5Z3_9CYAN|nr:MULTISPECIES: aspartyl/asparaginyl beta-hydroxylase domain-containing protein [Calothrix]MBD2195425.1 aspartyl/asparaginyl beta-hydroxylase domain-containing protein [Calothrix parietina FACHB-288]MBD2229798.1 aspartyl/asparaginyl beta-hydroxylase domain-containing protein [Calothrix anomala FACHB-343]